MLGYLSHIWILRKSSVVSSHQGTQFKFCVPCVLVWVCRCKHCMWRSKTTCWSIFAWYQSIPDYWVTICHLMLHMTLIVYAFVEALSCSSWMKSFHTMCTPLPISSERVSVCDVCKSETKLQQNCADGDWASRSWDWARVSGKFEAPTPVCQTKQGKFTRVHYRVSDIRQDPPPPLDLSFLSCLTFFAPWYRQSRLGPSVKIA